MCDLAYDTVVDAVVLKAAETILRKSEDQAFVFMCDADADSTLSVSTQKLERKRENGDSVGFESSEQARLKQRKECQ